MHDKIFDKIHLVMPKYNRLEKIKLQELKNDKRLSELSPIAIDILYNRGLRSVEDIQRHLYATMKDTYNPELLYDSYKFVTEVQKSIKNNEHIVFYSDFDVDGVTSASIGVLSIRNAGGNADYFTNNRFVEGYGICPAGVDRLIKQYPDVKMIITTDNGIVGFDGVKRASELGIKVLITDHHEESVDGKVPEEALAVVDPKRHQCQYPFKDICGAAVIYKLMLLLYFNMQLDLNYIYSLTDLLALGTVADIMPLVDENRVFVKQGLKLIRNENRFAFQALREELELSSIDEETLGFVYGPMINAIGRIKGIPYDAIDMFLSDDEDKIRHIAKELNDINEIRKTYTKNEEKLGEAMVNELPEVPDVIVLKSEEFNEGIVGLVASRIKEKYNRPVIVCAYHKQTYVEDGILKERTILKGSARSIEGFHIKNAFDETRQYLLGYGGHAMAGGLSLTIDNFEKFDRAINEVASKVLSNKNFVKNVLIDAPLKSREITTDLIRNIEILRPFGTAFTRPRFGLSEFKLDCKKNDKVFIGKDNSTLRLVSSDGLVLIMFKNAQRYKDINMPNSVKAVGYPFLNIFNGNSYPQFRVEDNYVFNAD